MPQSVTDIEKKLISLRLHGMAQSLPARILQAQQAGTCPLEVIAALIQDELDSRLSSLTQRRFKASGLDERKLRDDFDWGFMDCIPSTERLTMNF